MTPNNNLTPLAWYRYLSAQDYRKSYAFGNSTTFYTPKQIIPPFQLSKEHAESTSLVVKLFDYQGLEVADITTLLTDTGLSVHSGSVYDKIVYSGVLPIPEYTLDLAEGRYYMSITDSVSGAVWYSDIFTMVFDCTHFLKITWWDSEDLVLENGDWVKYAGIPYRNTVYLSTEVGKPEYKLTETVVDRDGFVFAEKRLSQKIFHFNFVANEPLLDALRIASVSDYIQIESLGYTYDCDTLLITPEWTSQANIASVEAEFTNGTVIKKIGRGRIPGTIGDFNSDYNEDFYNGVE